MAALFLENYSQTLFERAADLALCRRQLIRLTKWECEFVASLSERRSSITPKQLEVLTRIAGKLRRAGAV